MIQRGTGMVLPVTDVALGMLVGAAEVEVQVAPGGTGGNSGSGSSGSGGSIGGRRCDL